MLDYKPHQSVTFLVELIFLLFEFVQIMIVTGFRYIFKPTEKSVRNVGIGIAILQTYFMKNNKNISIIFLGNRISNWFS